MPKKLIKETVRETKKPSFQAEKNEVQVHDLLEKEPSGKKILVRTLTPRKFRAQRKKRMRVARISRIINR